MDIAGLPAVILFFMFLFSTKICAYPQFFTQDSARCLKCHTSENGHGFLNPNGKVFAIEQWAENKSKYYQIDLPAGFNLGLRTKHQQSFYQSDYVKEAKFKDLSTEIRSEFSWNQLRSYFSIARYNPTETDISFKDYLYISNLYISYDANSYLKIKIGKYFLDYGFDQMNLNYDQNDYSMSGVQKGQSKNQATIFYAQDKYEIIFSKILSRANYNRQFVEDGYFLKYTYIVSTEMLLGINFFKTTVKNILENNEDQILQGIFGIYKPDSVQTYLFQVDQNVSATNKKGISVLFRPSYVFKKGHLMTAALKYLNYDIELTDPKFLEVSFGYQYFPFAQFNIFANYKKTANTNLNTFIDDQRSDSINLDFNFLM